VGAERAPRTVDLDSQEPRFVAYLEGVRQRIKSHWGYPDEALALGLGGELLLVFTLNQAGSLTDVHLVHSSGFPILDQQALRAVQLAAPYEPFPPELGEEPWEIAASFHYSFPRRDRRR
jgi:protein TonB